LEERVGRHVRSFLGDHPLGVADDDDFSSGNCGSDYSSLDEVSCGGDVDPLRARRRWIKPTCLGPLGDRLEVIVSHLVEIRIGVLESRPWKNPMKIRMRQRADVTTAWAFSARRARLAGAEKLLGDRNCQALLADPAGSLQQKARWQTARPDAGGKPLTKLLMTEKLDDCHVEI